MRVWNTVLVVAVLASQAVWAQPGGPGGGGRERGPGGGPGGPGGGGHDGGRGGDRMSMMVHHLISDADAVAELGITSEQITTLKDGMFKNKEKEIDLEAAMKKAGMKQAKLISADEIDEEAVLDAVREAGKLRTQMATLKAKNLLLLRKTLTKEQVDGARKVIRKQMHSRMKERGGDHRRDGRSDRGRREGGGPDRERKRECPADKPASE